MRPDAPQHHAPDKPAPIRTTRPSRESSSGARDSYRTREEAELDLVRWIDGWYNPSRIQRELGWLSPDEYQEAYSTLESTGTMASPARAR